jgi:hypothetical protein
VLEALTGLLNTYVLGSDRSDLVLASPPAAAHQAVVRHQRQEQTIQRRLDDWLSEGTHEAPLCRRTRMPEAHRVGEPAAGDAIPSPIAISARLAWSRAQSDGNAAAAAATTSSCGTSRTRVATPQRCPNGSMNWPNRSPQNVSASG